MSSDQLGLVETALPATGISGRCPGDHIDVDSRTHPDLLKASPHETGEVPSHRASIVELEAEDDLPRPTGERNRHQHARTTRGRCEQREPAGATDRRAGCIAASAPHGEHLRQQATDVDQPTRTLATADGSRRCWRGEGGRDRSTIEHVFSLRKGCDTLPD